MQQQHEPSPHLTEPPAPRLLPKWAGFQPWDVPPWLRAHTWEPGTSGNPKGRPKGRRTMAYAIRQQLRKDVIQGEDTVQRIDICADALVREMEGGNTHAFVVVAKHWPQVFEDLYGDDGRVREDVSEEVMRVAMRDAMAQEEEAKMVLEALANILPREALSEEA